MTVGADQHRIADDFAAEGDVAADDIVEGHVDAGRHPEANDRMLPSVHAGAHLVRRELTARARISRRTAGGQHFAPVGIEFLRRAETVVRVAAGQELVGVGRIEVQPLRLPIRAVRPLDVRPFVPVQTQPAKVVEDAELRLTRRALDVGVFDTQDERAVLAVREQPVEERRARVADVQLTGW